MSSFLDLAIKQNSKIYFKGRNASYTPEIYIESDQKEVLEHLRRNPDKYLAAILPGIKICGCEIPDLIGEVAKSLEFVLAFDCCAPERGRLSFREYGKDKRRIEFVHYIPTLYKPGCAPTEEEIGDYSLREVLSWYLPDLKGIAREKRKELLSRFENLGGKEC